MDVTAIQTVETNKRYILKFVAAYKIPAIPMFCNLKREIQIQMSLVGVKTDEWVSAVQIAGIGKL